MAPTLPQPLPAIPQVQEVMRTTDRHISEQRSLVHKIIHSVTPSTATFNNGVLPLEELRNAQSGEKAVIEALGYCSPSLDCQHASEAAQEAFRAYQSSARQPELYNLLQAVHDKNERLDEESQKLLDRSLLVYTEDGFGKLDEAGIRHRQERTNRITTLSTAYLRNLRDAQGGQRFTPEEVDGVPASKLELVGEDGKAFYSYHEKYFTVMLNAHSSETRHRMAEGYGRIHAENVSIFRQVILLRDENARELGAASHAAARLPYRLAGSLEWLDEFLSDVVDTLVPPGRVEYEKIAQERRRCLKEI